MCIVLLCVSSSGSTIVDLSLSASFDCVITWTHSFKILKANENRNAKPSFLIK